MKDEKLEKERMVLDLVHYEPCCSYIIPVATMVLQVSRRFLLAFCSAETDLLQLCSIMAATTSICVSGRNGLGDCELHLLDNSTTSVIHSFIVRESETNNPVSSSLEFSSSAVFGIHCSAVTSGVHLLVFIFVLVYSMTDIALDESAEGIVDTLVARSFEANCSRGQSLAIVHICVCGSTYRSLDYCACTGFGLPEIPLLSSRRSMMVATMMSSIRALPHSRTMYDRGRTSEGNSERVVGIGSSIFHHLSFVQQSSLPLRMLYSKTC